MTRHALHRAAPGPFATALLLAAPLLLAAAAQAHAQPASFTDGPDRIPVGALERALPELLYSAGLPGLSLAVVEDGRIAATLALGVRDRSAGGPVTPGTVFEAASLTKPVFTVAVLRLVERGDLDLDRPLAEILPNADVDDPRAARITTRMILSHTSGFPNWRGDGPLTIGPDPGTTFRYSGEGFVYLSKVVEAVSGEPVHAFVAREVLEPLGMESSSLVWEERFADRIAIPHDQNGDPMEKERPEEANVAGSLHTTAGDYARFLIGLMEGAGLRPETAREMLTPQVEIEDGVRWGLGIGLQDDTRGRAAWHWGHNRGGRAYAIVYPERGDAVVWLANGENGLAILDDILRIAFGPDHPGAEWIDYEQHDDPARVARLELVRMFHEEGVEAGLRRMQALESDAPPEALDESAVNRLGYALLRDDLIDAAITVFKRNVERFPESSNVHDSLGEAYFEKEAWEASLASYERSVELDPESAHGRDMIERIREKMAEQSEGP